MSSKEGYEGRKSIERLDRTRGNEEENLCAIYIYIYMVRHLPSISISQKLNEKKWHPWQIKHDTMKWKKEGNEGREEKYRRIRQG